MRWLENITSVRGSRRLYSFLSYQLIEIGEYTRLRGLFLLPILLSCCQSLSIVLQFIIIIGSMAFVGIGICCLRKNTTLRILALIGTQATGAAVETLSCESTPTSLCHDGSEVGRHKPYSVVGLPSFVKRLFGISASHWGRTAPSLVSGLIIGSRAGGDAKEWQGVSRHKLRHS